MARKSATVAPSSEVSLNRLAVVNVIVLSILFLACGGAGSSSVKAVPREEFKRLVEGKTETEVMAAVGTPDETSVGGSWKRLYYSGRTFDPATGKPDSSISVEIDRRTGKVGRVSFSR
jgi:hypothetical protein